VDVALQNGSTYYATQTLGGLESFRRLAVTVNLKQSSAGELTITTSCGEPYTLNGKTYTVSGDYVQHLTNAAGCDSTLTLHLTVDNFSLVSQYWSDMLVADNSSGEYVSWQWYKDGQPIPGAKKQYYQSNNGFSGVYQVEATTAAGVVVMSCPFTPVAIPMDKTIKLVPNPVKAGNRFNVQTNLTDDQLVGAVIRVVDMHGLLLSTETNVKKNTGVISPRISGVYTVILTLKNGEVLSSNLLVD
jgi:hypothetical protein